MRIAYAVTIHKSQGMTLSKVVIELGIADFSRGLSFVAISQARALKDIAFLSVISSKRLKRLGGMEKVQPDIERQALQFVDGELAAELGYHFNQSI